MSFTATFSLTFWFLMAPALAVSAMGFYKYVYFISLGYGFSIALQGAALLLLFREAAPLPVAALCLLLGIYGLRLGGYLLGREISSSAYRSAMKRELKSSTAVSIPVKLCIWVSCALLYTLQVSPVLFRLQNGVGSDWAAAVGGVIMLGGILLEAAADRQKSMAKALDPKRFCDTGLYRLVRFPNYLGEILFWTGVFLSGVTAYQGPWQWGAGILGWVCIVYIMFGGARRLELRQNRNYGQDPAYQQYVKKTPILLPFVPLYSVAKYRFLVG